MFCPAINIVLVGWSYNNIIPKANLGKHLQPFFQMVHLLSHSFIPIDNPFIIDVTLVSRYFIPIPSSPTLPTYIHIHLSLTFCSVGLVSGQVTVWDFAGQQEYTTHQFFLSMGFVFTITFLNDLFIITKISHSYAPVAVHFTEYSLHSKGTAEL